MGSSSSGNQILGLSYDTDAAACLVRDGRVLAACAEERFTRVKHDRSFPNNAMQFCLSQGDLAFSDLDWVAMGWNPTIHLQPLLWRRSTRIRHHGEYLSAVPNLLLQAYPHRPRGLVTEQLHHFEDGTPPLRVAYVQHHVSHAAWAFVSPFERAAIQTIDGFGEQTTTMQAVCEGNQITVLQEVLKPHSLGSLYAAITQYLGFRPNQDEGTVMSLAAMDEPRFLDDFRAMVRVDEQTGGFEMDLTYFDYYQEATSRVSPKFVEQFGPPRRSWDEEITPHHKQIAASLQQVFEEAYMASLRALNRRTGLTDLVVAGGVALNCVANGKIREQTPFTQVFIPPASGDDGAATGAALYLHHQHLGNPREGWTFDHAFWGPGYTDEDVAALLDLARRRHVMLDPELTPRVAARLLTRGKIVGWFQGRAEFGPRALGNRTILADPRAMEVKDRLNATIKFRLPFRPFAPSMLEDRCGDLFIGGCDSPFMLMAWTVKPEWAARVPGILHTDDTARVQTVTESQNPRYFRLISHFDKLTGVPVVLNTSLNVRGEPIANTPKDALACFDSSAMDFLVLENHVLFKDDCQQALQQALDSEQSATD